MANRDQPPADAFARSPCPVANALDLVGDRWSLLLIRDLLGGAKTFGELLASGESIATNVLAQRLQALQDAKLIDKRLYCERPKRYSYSLTAKGRDFGPVLLALVGWGEKHVPGALRTAGPPRASDATRRSKR